MASLRAKLSLLILFSLSLLIKAHTSDSNSLSLVLTHLSLTRQLVHFNLCDSAGITCDGAHRVTRIVLDSRNLDGYLSSEIGNLSELKELSLSNNQIVDVIPQEIVDLKKLEVLNLRNNRLIGEIPIKFTSLVKLRFLDLSLNKFSGDLGFLKHFPNLERFDVSENLFSGKVPTSVKSLSSIRFVNVSGNNLFLRKNVFPKRYVFAEKKNSTESTTNSNSSQSGSPESPEKPKKKRHVKGWIIGFVSGLAAGILSGLVFSVLFKFVMVCLTKREKDTGTAIFSPLIKKEEDLAFLEKEDGLASFEIIGRGGCGVVYKAELPGSDGKMIAIKKIIQPAINATELTEEDSKFMSKKMRQIRSEIQTVAQIRHRNLLSLLAHVSRPDCHYLLYEFMKNGSLQDVLKQVSEGTRELDWLMRHRIAVGIAAGLEYLHNDHSPKIIHRDLKPANILLDDDMEARIADFGLAKVIPDIDTHMTTSNVAGTVGYIAPEYYQTFKFTDKCDVYSFGVVLAVLVMGKLPSDEFFQRTHEMSLVKWLRNVMTSESPKMAIDPNLAGNGFDAQMLLVLKIACFCTLDDAKQRPNSKDVRCMLMQITH
ncbi:hypothetical protein GIB67_027751 [Kingdonia uniflora]|uniref:Protein kinase domain-containing protein n=1 Tax=Kingdonia uniflora TaxID=39325 RepID=A0A7J7PBX7_9MAGN|nr:hypothetical protein GIB67_027751 [Kingdonia uniflora]